MFASGRSRFARLLERQGERLQTDRLPACIDVLLILQSAGAERAVGHRGGHGAERGVVLVSGRIERGAGSRAGLGAGLGLVVLLELLNQSIRRPVELTKKLGIQPFATIPYIATRGEVIRGRLKTLAGVAAVAAAVPAALYVVHYQIIPIDLLFTNVMERFGLDGLIASLG
mgnify:CR=1 FL=1